MSEAMALLQGVRILDLSRAVAGPYCTMLLGDFGASVIKLEPPTGDMGRAAGLSHVAEQSTYFLSINRNKRSIVVDLQREDGRDILAHLIRWADVLVENFRPGVIERLGFETDRLRELNPALIVCSISGYGQLGPYRDRKGLDLTGQAMGGLVSITGEPDGQPIPAGGPVSDMVTGLNACVAVLAALVGRQRRDAFPLTTIDVSLVASTISMLSVEATSYLNTGNVPERHGGAWFQLFPYDVFPTRDGWIAIGAGRDFAEFCELVGAQDLAAHTEFQDMPTRLAHRVELKRLISEATRAWLTNDLVDALQKHDILCSPVNSVADVVEDQGLRGEGVQLAFEHPLYGRVRTVDSAPIFWVGAPGERRWTKNGAPAPLMGEHTVEILKELGYDDDSIDRMAREGTVSFLP